MMVKRSNGMECERVRLRVGTTLGDFVVLASARGLRAVTPLAAGEGAASAPPHEGDGAWDCAPAAADDGSARETARTGTSRTSGIGDSPAPPASDDALRYAHAAADSLRRYAAGEPVRYEGPLDAPAPTFHVAVWEQLRLIPFGTTRTYGEIAAALGVPGEARLVGSAAAANPVCVLVPCHRVVGADGRLRGFAWGLDLKRRLLAHEGCASLPLFAPAGEPRG